MANNILIIYILILTSNKKVSQIKLRRRNRDVTLSKTLKILLECTDERELASQLADMIEEQQ